jgi:predicted RNase H-like HicB family nuclease
MKTVDLNNIVWKEGSHYVAQCLNIDVSSFGDTKEEALTNLDEAITLFLEDAPADAIQSIQSPEIVKHRFHYA